MRQLSTRDQLTLKFTTLGHRIVLNNAQSPIHIVSFKRPNVKQVKRENYGLIYVQHNEQKTKILHSNKRQSQNYRLLNWDNHVQNVAGLNSFEGFSHPLNWNSGVTVQHKNHKNSVKKGLTHQIDKNSNTAKTNKKSTWTCTCTSRQKKLH